MPCITFISALNVLPTVIVLLFFFAVDRVTRHVFKLRFLVTCQPVLLDSFEVISGAIWCDKMWNGLWGGNSTVSLNIFFCVVLISYWLVLRYLLEGWNVQLCIYHLFSLFRILLPFQ